MKFLSRLICLILIAQLSVFPALAQNKTSELEQAQSILKSLQGEGWVIENVSKSDENDFYIFPSQSGDQGSFVYRVKTIPSAEKIKIALGVYRRNDLSKMLASRMIELNLKGEAAANKILIDRTIKSLALEVSATAFVQPKQNFFQKIVNSIFPSAHAQGKKSLDITPELILKAAGVAVGIGLLILGIKYLMKKGVSAIKPTSIGMGRIGYIVLGIGGALLVVAIAKLLVDRANLKNEAFSE